MSVRVKICGVTDRDDALGAVGAGADWIGFNFWPGSPRVIGLGRAAAIRERLPAGIEAVGIFVDAPRAVIEDAVRRVGLDLVQLHGDEAPEDCRGLPVPVIKAVRVRGDVSPAAQAARFDSAYLLLDAAAGPQYGGSGQPFEWRLAQGVAPGRLFLAGGLRPDNVAAAVRAVRPYAVDVASGVESAPGRKDLDKVREFIRNAKAA